MYLLMANLSKGAKGDDVRELQKLLNLHGAAIAVDGDFGPITEAAVVAFQKSNGLAEDGIVTDMVWTALWDVWLLTVTFSSKSDKEDVRMAQKRLAQLGYSLKDDGIYGSQTEKALRHYQALLHPVSSLKYQYLENLQKDQTLSKQNKKDSLVYIADIMLSNGYELAYVAGMLANAFHEGNVGQFESTNYPNINEKPIYLKYMDDLYDYKKLYYGKTIMDVSLSAVERLIKTLAEHNWEEGKFGLGSIQWTGSRCQQLVKHYRDMAGDSDIITENQALKAEGIYILEELEDVKQNYISIYPDWRKANAYQLNSDVAAESAAQALCRRYEIPADTEMKAMERGKTAIEIYSIMTLPILDFGQKKVRKRKKIRLWIEKMKKKLHKTHYIRRIYYE